MNKKFTRKEFVMFVGSMIGLFLVSRIPSTDSFTKSPLAKKLTADNHLSYGAGTYGGAHVG